MKTLHFIFCAEERADVRMCQDGVGVVQYAVNKENCLQNSIKW